MAGSSIKRLLDMLTVFILTNEIGRVLPMKEDANYVTICSGVEDLVLCDCRNTTVDCSYQELLIHPVTFPASTTHINLSNNKMWAVHTPFRGLNQLVHLDLSVNFIRFITREAFDNLHGLKELYLQNNLLKFTDQYLPHGLFSLLQSLEILDISQNDMWRSTGVYRDDLMINLQSLKHLSIDGLPSVSFGEGFSNLISLQDLHITGNITNLMNQTLFHFQNLSLSTLQIRNSELQSIDSHAFQYLTHMHTLDLSLNVKLGLNNAAKGWPGLRYTNIRALWLERATPYDTNDFHIGYNFFSELQHTNITSLNIAANHIKTMEGIVNEYLPHIEYFTWSQNMMTEVLGIVFDVGNMLNLKWLDCSKQVKRLTMHEPPNMMFLDILNNQYANWSPDINPIVNTSEIYDFNTKYYPLKVISNEEYRDILFSTRGDWPQLNDSYLDFQIVAILYTGPELQYINLSESLSISMTRLPTIFVYNAVKMKLLNYSGNGLLELANPFVLVNESESSFTIDLSRNGLQNFTEYFGIIGTNIGDATESLLLGHNRLGGMIAKVGLRNLKGFHRLKSLDLQYNEIKYLVTDTFIYFKELTSLNLRGNALRQVIFNVSYLSMLEQLDLAANLIADLDDTLRKALDAIADARESEGKSLEIVLEGNPLLCSCSTQTFLNWIKANIQLNNGVVLDDAESLVCVIDGQLQSFSQIEVVLKKLKRQCNITDYILSAFIPAAIISLIIGLSIFAKRHRWEIRYWFYSRIEKKNDKLEQLEFGSYMYDAYIVYKDVSSQWIVGQLLENTENHTGDLFKLCLENRDFTPGAALTDNIKKGIRSSHKIVLLINHAFLENGWCQCVTEMAHDESFTRKYDFIITILLEPKALIAKDVQVYATLQNILKKTKTCFQWQDKYETTGSESFWSQIREAIKTSVLKPVKCDCGRLVYRKKDAPYMTGECNNGMDHVDTLF